MDIMEHCNGIMHTVKSGDTLYSISVEYQVPLARLLQVNPYVDVYNLQVGETICIPVRKGLEKPIPPDYEDSEETTGNQGNTTIPQPPESGFHGEPGENHQADIAWEYTTRKGDTLEGVLGIESIPLPSGITLRLPR